ncbi:MFS transporter [Amycolatopsis sp. NPDC059090]|uniref:MFS transporter n=1 Tax=unclassified Amycolatopsis TaxID=2618356 RepID=UPI00366FD3C6
MSMPYHRLRASGVMLAGAAVAAVAAVFGFVRDLSMSSDGMPPDGMAGDRLLRGMPLGEMPEMFVALAGVLIAGLGAAMAGARRSSPRAALSRRARLLAVVTVTAALTIDISKTSTLGFVIPGMRAEYGLSARTASTLAVAGLAGTALGALVFGVLADRLGRRNAYLVATLGFAVTGACGSMPTFAGNLVMCALMGLAVGGLAPLLITSLGDLLGGGVRGPLTIALSALATAAGYLVASGSALWLEPVFGWRILWLIGVPTGIALALLTPLMPDLRTADLAEQARPAFAVARRALTRWTQYGYAVLVGLVTFGLTTWVPTLARAGQASASAANGMLVIAALAMVPFAGVAALLYLRIGPVWVSAGLALVTAALLFVLAVSGAADTVPWLVSASLVAALFSVNAMAAIFLPITADLAGGEARSRATGRVSFFNRIGGLLGPLLIAGLVSSLSDVLAAIAVLAAACAVTSVYLGYRYRVARKAAEPVPVS